MQFVRRQKRSMKMSVCDRAHFYDYASKPEVHKSRAPSRHSDQILYGVTAKICGSSGWHWRHVTILTPRTVR
jgi:hypothetical protein